MMMKVVVLSMLSTSSLSLLSYAESVGARHYQSSAKLNKGIEELFLDLCKRKNPFVLVA